MRDQRKLDLKKAFLGIVFAIALFGATSSPASASASEMYYSMGHKYIEEGKFDVAVLAFEKAVDLSPDWSEAHNALGEAYVLLLRFKDALAEFDKALKLKPNYTQAEINHRRTTMSVERYEPMKGSRLSRWHKAAILGSITAVIVLVSALVIHASS